MKNKENVDLEVVYRIRPTVKFDLSEGHIRIIKEQNHWSQRFFRRLGMKIPKRTYRELDDYGSFIFQNIDGNKTIEELGQTLSLQFDEAQNQLYERLVVYLDHLEQTEKWIEKIN